MTLYKIYAKQETYFEFDIEADSEGEALEKMSDIEIQGDAQNYAVDWYPIEVTDIEEEDELV